MKPTFRYSLLLAIAAVTAILFSNCNRGGGLNDDDSTLQLEFDLTEARPYQPISAVYKDGTLRNQSYIGTIGASEIVFEIAASKVTYASSPDNTVELGRSHAR